MDRSHRLLLYLLVGLQYTSAKLIPCDRLQNGRNCYIQNITIDPTENHSAIQFQNVLQLVIDNCTIKQFSRELFANLGETNFLTLKRGIITTVNFSSDTLHTLRIDKTGLRNLSIAAISNHNLNTLIINRNPLSILPNTIRYLFALSIVDLSQNKLNHVSLDWFQQMDNLLILDLSWNHIARIDGSSDLRLKRLKNFWINHNQLSQIPWFPIGFPKLERIRLSNNYWACSWIRAVRQQIWDRGIQLFDADEICSEKQEGGLCCYFSATAGTPQPKYEFVEIELQPQKVTTETEPMKLQSASLMMDPAEEKGNALACRSFQEKLRTMKRDMLILARERAEMEQQFAKKVQALQELLRDVREDLVESEKEVSRYRLKERLELIAKTDRLSGGNR
ncbi:phospholipase A2 inhibitor beta-like [Sabethes cyaneus]|uniref:phospholipase A2 inhibitor beta-like n=1 Tax=Sabethes cyaneus TaxID=53552 RepID=UPI00237D4864|nr:phospholipase A2 inhibitor beta-like [Sabethes cyaneus]